MKRLLVVLSLVFVLFEAARADAHELKPAVLSLKEIEAGRFELSWKPPVDQRELRVPVRPRFPEHCQASARQLACGERGLTGAIRFEGLEASVYRVVVQIVWLDGTTRAELVSGAHPELTVQSVGRGANLGELVPLAKAYIELGVEHILTGFDHLLFVLGLLILVGSGKRLIWTITAFTLAHSVTLALGVLGFLVVPRGPVEAVIALSILLVAVECSRAQSSITRRAPWAIAFGFGLLHGFGFAGALSEIGLPPGQIPLALASFNIGVELGQLAVIAIAIVLARLAIRLHERARELERPVVYLMGTAAAFWTIERLWALWSTA
jgi:hypothetical protein